MDEELIRITPDKEKAKSMLQMVEKTLDLIASIDQAQFPSHVTKEYYEVVRKLLSVILLLDGYKTTGEGAHRKMIEYIELHYSEFDRADISLIDELRIVRNKISYDGFFVKEDYIQRKKLHIQKIIALLKEIVGGKI